jgi:hypothetical protein
VPTLGDYYFELVSPQVTLPEATKPGRRRKGG